ncbi:MAG TPA: zinc ribbon domain-containing protein, partial [Ktedonobacteraceae bacterium]|nr:zinc ribbon domain-containing protein [Ktedonobacteraceae bacterium]
MQCPHCNAQLEDDTVFCGNCGTQVSPFQAQGATATYKTGEGEDNFATIISTRQSSQAPTPQTPVRNNALRSDTPYPGDDAPTILSSPQLPTRKRKIGRIVFIVAMVLIIIGVGTLGTIAFMQNRTSTTNHGSTNTTLATNANGTVSFSDNQNGTGHNNVVTINARGLTTPPSGSQYDAWIVDTQSERATSLGTLTQNKDGTYSVKSSNDQNVLSLGNRIVVTVEQGAATVPTGQVVLSASFPPKAFVHIKHLLVSFPDTPGKIGLLVGLLDQAQKLSSASQLLQSISASHNNFAIQCAAQSIIDIAEGTNGAHYARLANQCASANIAEVGDGYGLLGTGGYIANSKAHASLAATQSDTTSTIRVHAGHVAICLQNMDGWINTIDHDARDLLNNPTDSAKVQEIVKFANQAYNGFDANGDGTIDPIPGEGGAVTAYYHGQLMATLVLAP